MGRHYDEKTGIHTRYRFQIEGIEVDFNDSWCPGVTIALYIQRWRELLYRTIDCPKMLHWTLPEPEYLGYGLGIEYLGDGYMRHEMLATDVDAVEVAPGAVYDEQDVAHIAVTHAFSVGTATVWLKVYRIRRHYFPRHVDVRFCVEFASQADCTRFLHEDKRKLEPEHINDVGTDVAVINDIMRALDTIGDHWSARNKAAGRGIPASQFIDEYEPETQLIRHRGHDRPCYLSTIIRVEWSATSIPPTFPSPSDAFQSLKNLHLKFPSHVSHQDDLTISISAREISFLDGTNSVSAGNSFSINSVHRTVNINYINNTGDAFLAPISGGNVGGRNNVNTLSMAPPSKSHSPTEHSRAQGLLLALARRRAQSRPKKAEQSTCGVGRFVKARTRRARPY